MSANNLISAARKEGRAALDELAGKQLLATFGISVPKSVIVKDAAAAAKGIAGMQLPFALKVVSPEILHKSDAGGVKIGLKTADEVAQAITAMAAAPQIKKARVDGWLIEEMAPAGQEVVVGAVRDPALRVDQQRRQRVLQDIPLQLRDDAELGEQVADLHLAFGERGGPAVGRTVGPHPQVRPRRDEP